MKTVLVVTPHFPPLNNIAARRFGWMCTWFEEFGWSPYVLTTHSEGPISLSIPASRIFRIGRHPQSGAKIEQPGSSLSEKKHGWLARLGSHFKIRLRSIDHTAFDWYPAVLKSIDGILPQIPEPDLIMGSYSPSASLLIARKLSSRLDVPWVADYRDLASLRYYERDRWADRIDRLCEKRILHTASGITTISKTYSQAFADIFQKSSATVYNGFFPGPKDDPESSDEYESSQVQSLDSAYLYHAGRLYPHRMQALELLFKAMSNSPGFDFLFRSLGPPNLESELWALAGKAGVEKRVKLLPPADPSVIREEQKRALASLVLEELSTDIKWGEGFLTGKFLQLLPGRVPVLSICRPDNEMAHILEYTSRGEVCSTPAQIENFLKVIIEEPGRYHGIQQYVLEYSAKNQAKNLCNFLDQLEK